MRIMAVAWWYTEGRSGTFECQTDADFVAQWTALPDDGVLAFKFYFDAKAPTRLSQNLNGNDWYWIQPTDNGIVFGHSDDTKEDILTRYPGALLKRGMWTTVNDIQRVISEQAAATYWADDPLDISLSGCNGC
jgi:hypothetical protein